MAFWVPYELRGAWRCRLGIGASPASEKTATDDATTRRGVHSGEMRADSSRCHKPCTLTS